MNKQRVLTSLDKALYYVALAAIPFGVLTALAFFVCFVIWIFQTMWRFFGI
jgi:hypothetical protein